MTSREESTKDKIIEITAEIVNQKGIDATSINDILKATGLKKGSLYFHFPNKESIIFAVLEKAKKELNEFLNNSLKGNSPKECLNNFLENVFEKHKKKGFVGGCIFGNVTLEMSDKNNKYSKFVQNVFEEWFEKIKIIIENGQKENQINKMFSPESFAQFIVAAIEGGIMLSRLKKDEKPLKECIENLKKLLGI